MSLGVMGYIAVKLMRFRQDTSLPRSESAPSVPPALPSGLVTWCSLAAGC